MVILLHVIIALSSLVLATFSAVRPARRTLIINYTLIAATIASGTYLIVMMPAHMISSCEMGLTYLAFASALTVFAHVRLHKLVAQAVTTR